VGANTVKIMFLSLLFYFSRGCDCTHYDACSSALISSGYTPTRAPTTLPVPWPNVFAPVPTTAPTLCRVVVPERANTSSNMFWGLQWEIVPEAFPNAPRWCAASVSTSSPDFHVIGNYSLVECQVVLQKRPSPHLTKVRSNS
jgi:hypothetical protein